MPEKTISPFSMQNAAGRAYGTVQNLFQTQPEEKKSYPSSIGKTRTIMPVASTRNPAEEFLKAESYAFFTGVESLPFEKRKTETYNIDFSLPGDGCGRGIFRECSHVGIRTEDKDTEVHDIEQIDPEDKDDT
jgi:hypothetical protein